MYAGRPRNALRQNAESQQGRALGRGSPPIPLPAPDDLADPKHRLVALFRLLRPRQWVKNAFVLLAPLFGHAITAPAQAMDVILACVGFCLLSSAVYAINDIVDAEADRKHPVKRLRPVAAGTVTATTALLLASLLMLAGGVASWTAGPLVGWLALFYLVNSFAYSFVLKQRLVVDVICIAIGFLLRILAGAAAARVEPSSWLVACGFSIALFLGFCKRRSEIGCVSFNAGAIEARPVLSLYSVGKLDLLCACTATLAVITYMLYTLSPETIARHGTSALIYTSPLVFYCIFKFLMMTMDLCGEDAIGAIMGDKEFLIAGLAWFLIVDWILYG
jgi:4-hydroxybenzoate polyprenyltransferase